MSWSLSNKGGCKDEVFELVAIDLTLTGMSVLELEVSKVNKTVRRATDANKRVVGVTIMSRAT